MECLEKQVDFEKLLRTSTSWKLENKDSSKCDTNNILQSQIELQF